MQSLKRLVPYPIMPVTLCGEFYNAEPKHWVDMPGYVSNAIIRKLRITHVLTDPVLSVAGLEWINGSCERFQRSWTMTIFI